MKVNIEYEDDDIEVTTMFHDKDFWNLDAILAHVLHDAVNGFRSRRKISGDYPGHLDSNQEWLDILDEMIFAFYQIKEWYPDAPENHEDAIQYHDRIHNGLQLFAENFNLLWE